MARIIVQTDEGERVIDLTVGTSDGMWDGIKLAIDYACVREGRPHPEAD